MVNHISIVGLGFAILLNFLAIFRESPKLKNLPAGFIF